MSKMEERIEGFIEVVRNYPVLYNTTDKGYQNVTYKKKIWEQVAAETGFRSGSEAKIRWEKLRHSMRDAMRRRHNSSKEWKYLPHMAFLHPFMHKGPKRVADYCNESEEISFEDNDVSHEFQQELQENSLHGNEADYLSNSGETSALSSESLRKDIKLEDDNSHSFTKTPIEATDPLVATPQTSHGDPLQHFFLAMYGTTKKMPPAAQHAIKTQIFKIVSDVEGSLLNNTQPDTQDGKLISYINGFAES